jgi:hypothetical protein
MSSELTPQKRDELVRRHGDWAYLPDGTRKADWLLRLGPDGWEARCKANRRNMRISRARLALLRRDGYWFDEERRLQAPTTPPAPAGRANAHQGRSPRPSRRRRSRAARTSRGDPDPSQSPEPLVRPPLTAALRVWLKTEIDRRSRDRLKSERASLRAEAKLWELEP